MKAHLLGLRLRLALSERGPSSAVRVQAMFNRVGIAVAKVTFRPDAASNLGWGLGPRRTAPTLSRVEDRDYPANARSTGACSRSGCACGLPSRSGTRHLRFEFEQCSTGLAARWLKRRFALMRPRTSAGGWARRLFPPRLHRSLSGAPTCPPLRIDTSSPRQCPIRVGITLAEVTIRPDAASNLGWGLGTALNPSEAPLEPLRGAYLPAPAHLRFESAGMASPSRYGKAEPL